MKKFKIKQIREEIDGLREKVDWFPDIKMRAVGMILHADMLEYLLKENEKLRKKLKRENYNC